MSETRDVLVIGAGGHGKVVVSTLQSAGWNVVGLLDDDPAKRNSRVLGLPVIGSIQEASRLPCSRAILGIGDNLARNRVRERIGPIEWVTVIHPSAYVHSSVRLGPGTVVFAGAVVQPDTVIGDHCIINTGAQVDHDCVLGDYTHVAPGSQLGGNVTLGKGVFLGIGSSVLPGKRIGDWTVVGGGGVVAAHMGPNLVAVGVPARPIRKRSTE